MGGLINTKMFKKHQLLRSLADKGIQPRVLEAFAAVDRADFISPELEKMAYDDVPLPIGKGQTISQPYTVAVMLSLLSLRSGQKVLEAGSGSGYVLALLSHIVEEKGRVYGVEVLSDLVKKSRKSLTGLKNIRVYNKNGAQGLKDKAPFDRIIISAAVNEIPQALLHQLKPKGGILVAPKGSRFEQELVVIERKDNVFEIKKKVPGFLFVPFVGE